jgi:hypothetical protein
VALAIAVALAAGAAVQGQEEGGEGEAPPPAPAPRWPDGRVSFSGPPDDIGNWEGPANASIFFNYVDGKKVTPRASLPTNKTVDEIPFKPGMKELYLSREDQAEDDPHTRCKPSGGSRLWHTPYGIEILDLPETQEVIVLAVGAPHSWRIAYLDGREHPKDLEPSWYGHTTGKWEGDTLVLDTVGFNERFWLTREGRAAHEAAAPRRADLAPEPRPAALRSNGRRPGRLYRPMVRGLASALVGRQRTVRLPLPGKQQGSGADGGRRRRGQQPAALRRSGTDQGSFISRVFAAGLHGDAGRSISDNHKKTRGNTWEGIR